MKILDTKIGFFSMVIALFLIGFNACQKEAPSNDLTVDITGAYNGEYREGDENFTVIVSNVVATASRNSDNTFGMEMELVPGVFTVPFTAEMQSKTAFTVNAFDLDGDSLEGAGTLEGNLLKIFFFEAGTSKAYGSYIAQKQ